MSAKKAPRVHTSIARAPGLGFAESVGAKRTGKSGFIMPSRIRANHYDDNGAVRPAVYSLVAEVPELAGFVTTGKNRKVFADDRFCFRRADVLTRMDSFRAIGQEQPIKVYRSATMLPDVGSGFLRHVAGLMLEVLGELDKCPDMADGLKCQAEDRPTDPLILIAKSRAENESLPSDTPLSRAWLCRQLAALGKSPAEIGAVLGVRERMVSKYLQLLKQPAQVQVDVHEGHRTLSDVLAMASSEGKGGGKGARPGVSPARIAVALALAQARPMPTIGLSSAEEVIELAERLAGKRSDPTCPGPVQEWYRALAPEPDEIKAAKTAMRSLPGAPDVN